jgi:hypothetical protein
MAGPTPAPFKKTFACAAVAFVIIYGALWIGLGPPGNPSYIGGYIFSMVVIPALIVGFWASRSAKNWSLARIIVFYLIFLVIGAVLTYLGTTQREVPP